MLVVEYVVDLVCQCYVKVLFVQVMVLEVQGDVMFVNDLCVIGQCELNEVYSYLCVCDDCVVLVVFQCGFVMGEGIWIYYVDVVYVVKCLGDNLIVIKFFWESFDYVDVDVKSDIGGNGDDCFQLDCCFGYWCEVEQMQCIFGMVFLGVYQILVFGLFNIVSVVQVGVEVYWQLLGIGY